MLVQVLSLIVLLLFTIAPLSIFEMFLQPELQLIVATIVVATIVLYDAYTGFILSLAAIVLYFRLYGGNLTPFDDMDDDAARKKGPMANLVTKYITPQHLQAAQSNDVQGERTDSEIVGIQGVYGEPVYGAQGLDKGMPGFEKSSTLTGDYWSM
jgi:hypothetical protein